MKSFLSGCAGVVAVAICLAVYARSKAEEIAPLAAAPVAEFSWPQAMAYLERICEIGPRISG